MQFSLNHLWRTPDGQYLIQGTLEKLPDEVALPNDIQFAASYYLVTATAAIVRVYSHPIPYAIDDDQGYSNIHAVIGQELHSYHWIENYYHGVRVRAESVLTGLEQISADNLPFDPGTLEMNIKQKIR